MELTPKALIETWVSAALTFDRVSLLVGHALLGCRHQRCIDDLARHGDVTGGSQRSVEAIEQWLMASVRASFSRNSQIVRASAL